MSGRHRNTTNELSSTTNINSNSSKGKTVDEQTHQLLQMINNQSYNKRSNSQPQDKITTKKPRLSNTVAVKNDAQNADVSRFDDPNDNTYCGIDLVGSMYDQQQRPNTTTEEDEDSVVEVTTKGDQQVSNGVSERNSDDNYDFDENIEEANECGNEQDHTNGLLDDKQQQQQSQEGDVEEEPDWDSIALHEPSKTDVPIFLSARDRKDAADDRFAAALDECHSSLKELVNRILSAAAEIYNIQREKIEVLELEIKQYFVGNEEARATMQRRLEESANAAQGLFSQLLQRVSQTVLDATTPAQMMLLNQQPHKANNSSENNVNQGREKINHRHQKTNSTFGNRNAAGVLKGKSGQGSH